MNLQRILEDQKAHYEEQLHNASEVIRQLKTKVTSLQTAALKPSVIQKKGDHEIENKQLRAELDIWVNKYHILENKYTREITKGAQANGNKNSSLGSLNGIAENEKIHYEKIIRCLLSEVEMLEIHPNDSSNIAYLVKDLESRIKRLLEVNHELQKRMLCGGIERHQAEFERGNQRELVDPRYGPISGYFEKKGGVAWGEPVERNGMRPTEKKETSKSPNSFKMEEISKRNQIEKYYAAVTPERELKKWKEKEKMKFL